MVEPIFSSTPVISAEAAANAANAAVRRFCRWHIAPVMREERTLDSDGGREVLLPTKRLTEVHSLSVLPDCDGVEWEDVEDFEFSESGIIRLRSGRKFPRRYRGLKVSFTHGYDLVDVPDVFEVVRSVASRTGFQVTGAITSQAIMGASVKYATRKDGAVVSLPLFESEKDILSYYRLNLGA